MRAAAPSAGTPHEVAMAAQRKSLQPAVRVESGTQSPASTCPPQNHGTVVYVAAVAVVAAAVAVVAAAVAVVAAAVAVVTAAVAVVAAAVVAAAAVVVVAAADVASQLGERCVEK